MTAILGKGALLNCRVRGIGNRTVCIAQNSFMKMFMMMAVVMMMMLMDEEDIQNKVCVVYS